MDAQHKQNAETLFEKMDEWSPESLPTDATILLYGVRRTGKSFWIRDLMYRYWLQGTQFWTVIVFSPTAFNGFFESFLCKDYIHTNYSPAVMAALLKRQSKLYEMKKHHPEYAHINFSTLVILDDVIQDADICKDTLLRTLFVAGRHYGICTILTTQDPKAVPPILRNNSELSVIFRQHQYRSIESLRDDYLAELPLKEATHLMKIATDNHGTIVVDRSSHETELLRCCFKYRAREVPMTWRYVSGIEQFNADRERIRQRELDERLRSSESDRRLNLDAAHADGRFETMMAAFCQ